MAEKRELHGIPTDNPLLRALLDLGNQLRYGASEAERVEMVNRLSAPGVRDAAFDERGLFDPAAAERYTSGYLFGKKQDPPDWLQPLLHALSGGSRGAMHAVGVPGVGEEREALTSAEALGMERGAAENEPKGPLPPAILLLLQRLGAQ